MFRHMPVSAMIGLTLTGLYFLAAIFAPLIAPYGMAQVVGDVWEPSSREHLLGTDNIGRDLLTRMIYGGRTTIFIATMATILDEFFILFYCAVAISVPILMVLAHIHTPAEYNENTFVGLVQKKSCCWKSYVPTAYFALRGLNCFE